MHTWLTVPPLIAAISLFYASPQMTTAGKWNMLSSVSEQTAAEDIESVYLFTEFCAKDNPVDYVMPTPLTKPELIQKISELASRTDKALSDIKAQSPTGEAAELMTTRLAYKRMLLHAISNTYTDSVQICAMLKPSAHNTSVFGMDG